MQARRGELVDVLEGPGLAAMVDGDPVGIVTWLVQEDGNRAEIRALAVGASQRGHGCGRALMDAAHACLRGAGVERSWLVTTNDNIQARRLYERLGYRLDERRAGAIDEMRRTIKPSLPVVGQGGIEMHDELELATELGSA